MKKTRIMALLCALALLLAGCGENKNGSMTAVPLEEKVKAAAADADSLVPVPAEDLYDLMGISPEDYSEAVYLTSADGLSAREIIALRARDGAAAGRIADALNAYLSRRMDETRNYLPEEYRLLSQTKVERKNGTVVLIAGADAAEETRKLLAGE